MEAFRNNLQNIFRMTNLQSFSEKFIYNTNDGALVEINACTDKRSWSIYDEDKRLFMLDYIQGPESKILAIKRGDITEHLKKYGFIDASQILQYEQTSAENKTSETQNSQTIPNIQSLTSLTMERDFLRLSMRRVCLAVCELEKKIYKFETERKKKKRNCGSCAEKLTYQATCIQNLEANLEILNTALADSYRDNDTLNIKLNDMCNKYSDIKKLETKCKAMVDERNILENQLQDSKHESKIKTKLQSRAQEGEILKRHTFQKLTLLGETILKLVDITQNLNKQKNVLREQIDDLQEVSLGQLEDLKIMHSEIEELSRKDSLRQKYCSLCRKYKEQIRDLKKTNESLKADVDAKYCSLCCKFKEQIRHLKKTKESLKADVDAASVVNEIMERKIDVLQVWINQLNTDRLRLLQRISDMGHEQNNLVLKMNKVLGSQKKTTSSEKFCKCKIKTAKEKKK